MRRQSDFTREITSLHGLDESFIVPVLTSSGSDELRDSWARDATRFGFPDYRFGIVMTEAERSLFTIFGQEVLSFEDLSLMLREVLMCIEHLHARGIVHADIKPLNVSRDLGATRDET